MKLDNKQRRDVADALNATGYPAGPCVQGGDVYLMLVAAGYSRLADVLIAALDQAQSGKGKERHATGQPFHEQPIVRIGEMLGSVDFALGQAIKKLQESVRLPPDRARAERLGAINYIAAAIVQADGGEK